MKHRKLVAWVFSASLFLFTVYAALDTFVLTRVYQTVEVTATGTASSNAGTDAEEAESESAETQSSGKSRRKSASSSAETVQSGLTFKSNKTAAVTAESYDDGNISVTLFSFLLERNRSRLMPGELPVLLWHMGLAALTVGSLFGGALEIYGTTSRLLFVYPLVGGILAGAGAVLALPGLKAGACRR